MPRGITPREVRKSGCRLSSSLRRRSTGAGKGLAQRLVHAKGTFDDALSGAMRPVGLGELVPLRWRSARGRPTAVLRCNPALAAPFEHRMLGDELSGVVDPQLLGESVHFHGRSGEAVRDRVLVALHAHHAVARQAPMKAKHRRVRLGRELLERLSLLGERFTDPPPGGAVHAPVRNRLAPLPEPGVQIVQIGELGAEEKILAHVPEHPLDLALGLRPVTAMLSQTDAPYPVLDLHRVLIPEPGKPVPWG